MYEDDEVPLDSTSRASSRSREPYKKKVIPSSYRRSSTRKYFGPVKPLPLEPLRGLVHRIAKSVVHCMIFGLSFFSSTHETKFSSNGRYRSSFCRSCQTHYVGHSKYPKNCQHTIRLKDLGTRPEYDANMYPLLLFFVPLTTSCQESHIS